MQMRWIKTVYFCVCHRHKVAECVLDVHVVVIICQALNKAFWPSLWMINSLLNPTQHVLTRQPFHSPINTVQTAHTHNAQAHMLTYTPWHTPIHTHSCAQICCSVYALIEHCTHKHARAYIFKPHTHTNTDVTRLSWGLLYWLVLTAL